MSCLKQCWLQQFRHIQILRVQHFALLVANSGSISGIPDDPLNLLGVIYELRANSIPRMQPDMAANTQNTNTQAYTDPSLLLSRHVQGPDPCLYIIARLPLLPHLSISPSFTFPFLDFRVKFDIFHSCYIHHKLKRANRYSCLPDLLHLTLQFHLDYSELHDFIFTYGCISLYVYTTISLYTYPLLDTLVTSTYWLLYIYIL